MCMSECVCVCMCVDNVAILNSDLVQLSAKIFLSCVQIATSFAVFSSVILHFFFFFFQRETYVFSKKRKEGFPSFFPCARFSSPCFTCLFLLVLGAYIYCYYGDIYCAQSLFRVRAFVVSTSTVTFISAARPDQIESVVAASVVASSVCCRTRCCCTGRPRQNAERHPLSVLSFVLRFDSETCLQTSILNKKKNI